MSTITKSHLRRLTATILIGCAVLLPAFFGRAPAQTDRSHDVPSTAARVVSTPTIL